LIDCTPDTLIDHKNLITKGFSSLEQPENGAAMINGKVATLEVT
jgi:hypothetical protein